MNNCNKKMKKLSVVFKNLPQTVYGFFCEIEPNEKYVIVINEDLDFPKMELTIYACMYYFDKKVGLIGKKDFYDPNFEPILFAKKELKKLCTQNF